MIASRFFLPEWLSFPLTWSLTVYLDLLLANVLCLGAVGILGNMDVHVVTVGLLADSLVA